MWEQMLKQRTQGKSSFSNNVTHDVDITDVLKNTSERCPPNTHSGSHVDQGLNFDEDEKKDKVKQMAVKYYSICVQPCHSDHLPTII